MSDPMNHITGLQATASLRGSGILVSDSFVITSRHAAGLASVSGGSGILIVSGVAPADQSSHIGARSNDAPATGPGDDDDGGGVPFEVVRELTEEDLEALRAYEERTSPPAFADKLGYFLLSLEQQDELLGDLKERYAEVWLPELGVFWARCCYVWHVIRVSAALRWLALVGSIVGLWKRHGG
jgi:hypothetical protein